MKTLASMEIYAYWNVLRGNRAAPSRSDIDPSRIRHLLPDLFILTGTDNSSPLFRLTGTRLYNLFGHELRETAFATMWQHGSARHACRIAEGVMQHELPVRFDIEAESVCGFFTQDFEMLLLPLQAETHCAPRLLGTLMSDPPMDDFGQSFKPLTLAKSRLVKPPLCQPAAHMMRNSDVPVRYVPI